MREVGKRGVVSSIPVGDIYFHFEFFRLFLVPRSSAQPIQMKSSMTFIQNNIFNGGDIYDFRSALRWIDNWESDKIKNQNPNQWSLATSIVDTIKGMV